MTKSPETHKPTAQPTPSAVAPCSASDTPRTDAAVNAGGIQLLNVAECSRTLERELFAFKRSNERIIHDYNIRARDARYAEAMQRAAERETAALAERVKLLEEQRNTLNETCHTLRDQIAELLPNEKAQPRSGKSPGASSGEQT